MSLVMQPTFAQLADPSLSWGDLFADWIAAAEAAAAARRPASPRAGFLEPLPVVVAPRPSLKIRVPALRTWRCGCGAVLQEDFAECPDCAEEDESEEDESEEDEEQNEWYCRICDDFCSNGLGLCGRCERAGAY
jgi:hypothetical protein